MSLSPSFFISNSCISPLWTSRQCRQSGEFVAFRPRRFFKCSYLLMYALPRTPLYYHPSTFILWPLLEISFWYARFSFPSGVDGTNRTESKPQSLYQVRFFCSFKFSHASRFHCLGLLIGRIPKPCFFSIVWNAFFTAHMPLYRNDCVYSEYCIFLINLMTCAHTTSHGRCPLQWCAAFLV